MNSIGRCNTVSFTVDDNGGRRAALPVIAADEAAVRQHVERVTGTELATTPDACETVDVVDDVTGSSTYQVAW